eukprot:6212895-Pleurochrysis_carterae.AAC.2
MIRIFNGVYACEGLNATQPSVTSKKVESQVSHLKRHAMKAQVCSVRKACKSTCVHQRHQGAAKLTDCELNSATNVWTDNTCPEIMICYVASIEKLLQVWSDNEDNAYDTDDIAHIECALCACACKCPNHTLVRECMPLQSWKRACLRVLVACTCAPQHVDVLCVHALA